MAHTAETATTSSQHVLGLMRGGVPLALLIDLASVTSLPEGQLLESPLLDGLLDGMAAPAHLHYGLAV